MLKKAMVYLVMFLIAVTFISAAPAFCESENLLLNPGFEEVSDNLPSGWYTDAFINSPDAVEFKVEDGNAHTGSKCLAIINKKPNDSRFCQDIKVQPGSVYKISYWLKVDNIKEGGGGDNVTFTNGIYYSDFVFNTNGQWQKFDHYVKTSKDGEVSLKFWLRLGGFGAVAEGKVSFDDISIELVENPDPSVKIEECFLPVKNSEYASTNEGHKTGSERNDSGKTLWYILIGVAAVGLLLFAELRLIKHGKDQGKNVKSGEDYDYTEDINNE
jgi:dolichyl-phosphate-mannose-protein mannosyltransferase